MATLWTKNAIVWDQFTHLEMHTVAVTRSGNREMDPYELDMADTTIAGVYGRRPDDDVDCLAEFDTPEEARAWGRRHADVNGLTWYDLIHTDMHRMTEQAAHPTYR